MSKKGRAASTEREVEPLTGGTLELVLVLAVVATVAMVALWFKLDVMRVFDVPKALALKVGGCGVFLVWLLYGLFGPGVPWKSIRPFAAPVFALTGAVTVSTFLSIDVPMSFYGVYERQFGLQGFLGCIGLFAVTATCLKSRRGALACLGVIATIGGVMSSYALLQSKGLDPFGFFDHPHPKVYSTLGNATFAGNSLALIFPISMMLAIVAAARALGKRRIEGGTGPSLSIALAAFVTGFALVAVLQVIPGMYGAGDPGTDAREGIYKLGVGLSLVSLVALALIGTHGPGWARLESATARRLADAALAGGLTALVVLIAIGIVTTGTRGAWVGTAAAVGGGLLLLPFLFHDDPPRERKMRIAGIAALAVLVAAVAGLLVFKPDHLWSRLIKSIPYAFDPSKTVYGKGQGTRRYLWQESPRVLFDHRATLERQYEDHDEYARRVRPNSIDGLELKAAAPLSESYKSFDTAWRSIEVYFFGIGIETYRFAFMSHKSKLLEALDPMTNHDNPHNNYLYVLASFGIVGLIAYLWLLQRLLFTAFRRFWGRRVEETEPGSAPPLESREARAIAFGVVMSFFSYATYSIAGFDSVCCSVFLYFMLGAAAVFFDPNGDEPRRPLWVSIRRHWAAFRGRDPHQVPSQTPMGLSILTAAVVGALLIASISGALTVNAAEQAFVGGGSRRRDFMEKLEDMKRAIQINPYESHYKQNLGAAYADAAHQLRSQAARLQQAGKANEARMMSENADAYSEKAEVALYAALDHAWAPENIFISLFQLYYGWRKLPEAEYALKRGLEHSPHLGAVRANLAILELEREGYGEALTDCKWVLEVDKESEIALRTCGRASFMLGDYEGAKGYLERALPLMPNDPTLHKYLADLKDRISKPAATASTAAKPG